MTRFSAVLRWFHCRPCACINITASGVRDLTFCRCHDSAALCVTVALHWTWSASAQDTGFALDLRKGLQKFQSRRSTYTARRSSVTVNAHYHTVMPSHGYAIKQVSSITYIIIRLASILRTVVLRNVSSRPTVTAARGSKTARASSRTQGNKAEDKDEECNSRNPFSTLSEQLSEHESSEELQTRSSAVRSEGKVAASGVSCTSPPPPATSTGAGKSSIWQAFSSMRNAAQIHNHDDRNSNAAASAAAAGGGSRE
jgi:hypothetical protein